MAPISIDLRVLTPARGYTRLTSLMPRACLVGLNNCATVYEGESGRRRNGCEGRRWQHATVPQRCLKRLGDIPNYLTI